jgi:hypothetical protein
MMYSHLESVICDMFYIHPYGEMIGSRNENKCECEPRLSNNELRQLFDGDLLPPPTLSVS